MTVTELGKVKLIEKPNKDNGWFYVVKNDTDQYHVSSLFGKAAEKMKIGSTLNLSIRSENVFTAYVLSK